MMEFAKYNKIFDYTFNLIYIFLQFKFSLKKIIIESFEFDNKLNHIFHII